MGLMGSHNPYLQGKSILTRSIYEDQLRMEERRLHEEYRRSIMATSSVQASANKACSPTENELLLLTINNGE